MYERRNKIIRIDPRVLVDAFNGATQVLADGVPPDAEVIAIHSNYSCRSLDVLVYHPSFDVVPDGCECPAEYVDLRHAGIRPDRGACRVDGGANSWRDRPSML